MPGTACGPLLACYMPGHLGPVYHKQDNYEALTHTRRRLVPSVIMGVCNAMVLGVLTDVMLDGTGGELQPGAKDSWCGYL